MVHNAYFLECPCGADCDAGCQGCDNPICNEATTTRASTTSTTTATTAKPTNEAVLLLSTRNSNVPMVIDFEGKTLTVRISLEFSLKVTSMMT